MTADDKALLYFERQHPRPGGAKDHAIQEALDMSPTRYYQRIVGLLDDPDAYEYDPQLMKRLRRLRASRRSVRARA